MCIWQTYQISVSFRGLDTKLWKCIIPIKMYICWMYATFSQHFLQTLFCYAFDKWSSMSLSQKIVGLISRSLIGQSKILLGIHWLKLTLDIDKWNLSSKFATCPNIIRQTMLCLDCVKIKTHVVSCLIYKVYILTHCIALLGSIHHIDCTKKFSLPSITI